MSIILFQETISLLLLPSEILEYLLSKPNKIRTNKKLDTMCEYKN